MQPLAIVLVSDLHAGPDNNYPELRVRAGTPAIIGTNYQLTVLVEAVKGLLDGVPKQRRILICTGDLSSTCHSEELQSAGKFLADLADGLDIKQRFLVPGNHDIDWNLTKLGADTDRWYDDIRQQKFEDLIRASAKKFAFPSKGKVHRQKCCNDEVEIFLLDSPFEDKSTTQPHHGRLGGKQIEELASMLSEAAPSALRIVVLHHHVSPVGVGAGHKDFSQLQDARELLSVLERYSVQLVLHGHQHRPYFQRIPCADQEIVIVSSGSTTAHEHRITYQVPSTFHVVTIEDPTARPICGAVHTRMFSLVNGWQAPSLKAHNVAARRPFGFPHGPAVIGAWIEEAVTACRTKGMVKLDLFLKVKTGGAYLCQHEFRKAISDHLAIQGTSADFEFMHDDASDCVQIQSSKIGMP